MHPDVARCKNLEDLVANIAMQLMYLSDIVADEDRANAGFDEVVFRKADFIEELVAKASILFDELELRPSRDVPIRLTAKAAASYTDLVLKIAWEVVCSIRHFREWGHFPGCCFWDEFAAELSAMIPSPTTAWCEEISCLTASELRDTARIAAAAQPSVAAGTSIRPERDPNEMLDFRGEITAFLDLEIDVRLRMIRRKGFDATLNFLKSENAWRLLEALIDAKGDPLTPSSIAALPQDGDRALSTARGRLNDELAAIGLRIDGYGKTAWVLVEVSVT